MPSVSEMVLKTLKERVDLILQLQKQWIHKKYSKWCCCLFIRRQQTCILSRRHKYHRN